MQLHTSQLKQVTSHDLNNGDIINAHGALLRLRDRSAHSDAQNKNMYGDVVHFAVDVLVEGNTIPKHWLQDFAIQGNGAATWARVTDTEILTKYAA